MSLFSSIFIAILVVLASFQSINAEKLEFHSFEPPFEEVDHGGIRQISRHWRSFGTAVVNNNFIRLTPDRQSKKGALWTRKSLGVNEFNTILKFRISGQGKNFFGDGLALWIVDHGYYSEGSLHGFQEKFVGVGIIFDTFKNTESINQHRDVTVIVNDGEKTFEMMTEEVKGCNINVRYHADRADFSVTDASRAKLAMTATSLQISVDARNTGDWTPCATVPIAGLPADWISKSHIGITASTGQLADNHDVISLLSFSDSAVMETADAAAADKKHFESRPDLAATERIGRLETAFNDALARMEVMDHHVEHELVSVEDHIDNLIAKLAKREDNSESRIVELENLVKKEVEGSLSSRLNRLERSIKEDVNRKLSRIEQTMDKLKITVDSSDKLVSSAGGNWKTPFIILAVFVVAASIGLYFFYQHLLKKWKLP